MMDIKILDNLTATYERRKYCVIGTHNGVFYSDEVVAIAIFSLINQKKKIRIVRTNNAEILKKCHVYMASKTSDYQALENLVKENEIPCINLELVWQRFGKNLIYNYMSKYFPTVLSFVKDIFKKFSDDVISLLESETNGIEANSFSFISSFLPSWNDSTPDFDGQFLKVLEITLEVFKQELSKTIESFVADKFLKSNWKKYFSDNILEIPSQTIPWIETVIAINKTIMDNNVIDFVIYPHPDGGWAAECVPISLENRSEKRILFPKEWAGQSSKKIKELTKVEDAMCNDSCSCIRARTKEDVRWLCISASF